MESLSLERIFHPSGALYIPCVGTLVVADLHLGYGLAQRRRGQLGPIVDTETSQKLHTALEMFMPESLVLLGDAVHAPRPGALEHEWVSTELARIRNRCSVVFVTGNHDRALAQDFGLSTVDCWRQGGWIGVHGHGRVPEPQPGECLLLGHFHPAIGIVDRAGVKSRMPAFIETNRLVVLPAFSPFAAGMDLTKGLPAELMAFGEPEDFRVHVATGKRVVEVGTLSQRWSTSAGSRPEDFRRYRNQK